MGVVCLCSVVCAMCGVYVVCVCVHACEGIVSPPLTPYTPPSPPSPFVCACVCVCVTGNKIGDAGASALAPALAQMKQLKELWLYSE